MKYEHEYKVTDSKKNFVTLLMRKYDDIKESTAIRRFYDLRKKFGLVIDPKDRHIEILKQTLDEDKIVEPNNFKMLMLEDMKSMNTRITRRILIKHGITPPEINWLIINKRIENV